MAELYRYAAFISYSSKDAAFARRLHRALESYGIPASLGKFDLIGGGKKNRIYPVFRDREELSAGQLSDQIEANLRAAAALIVICSPNSAMSPWVQKEIEFFEGLGRRSKIFAIIPDDAPLTDEAGADCTPTCFPPAFRGDALQGDALEPLAADARKGKDGFRNAWLKIVAGMIGVTPGQIIDRDRKRRREHALQAAAVWGVALLGAGYAYSQRQSLEPLLASWTRYRPYVVTRDTLMAAVPGTTFQDCRQGSSDCPLMVLIPEGRFLMGSASDEPENFAGHESPQRQISIARFAVSQNEVTFGDWQACLDGGGCGGFRPDPGAWEGNQRPVINVSWDDAQMYVNWLSRMTGQDYRLLSEAEWEYAARGVTVADVAHHTRFSWGDDDPVCDRHAPNGASSVACPERGPLLVGSFPANDFGLHDMHGNVSEWVQDCYAPYDPNKRDGSAVGSDGRIQGEGAATADECTHELLSGREMRVLRGGSWYGPRLLRSAIRQSSDPTLRDDGVGFRVARTL